MNIKKYLYGVMAQETSESTKVGSESTTLTQLVTTGAGGRLDASHHALNM